MIEEVKKNGKVILNECSKQQIVTLLCMWDTNYAKAENNSFTQMLGRCYKSKPWHAYAPIIYLHKDGKATTVNKHVCRDLAEFEEEQVMQALMK